MIRYYGEDTRKGGNNMFKNDKYERFHVEKCSHAKGISCYILTDKETGIQYLSNWTGAGGGITPLLDKNGHISKVDPSTLT